MRPARINITKFFTQPSVANIAISVVVSGLLWFLFNTQQVKTQEKDIIQIEESFSNTETLTYPTDDLESTDILQSPSLYGNTPNLDISTIQNDSLSKINQQIVLASNDGLSTTEDQKNTSALNNYKSTQKEEKKSEFVSTLFMKHFVMWSLPIMWSRILGFLAMMGLMLWLMLLCNQLQIIPVRSSMPLTIGMIMASCIGYIQPFDESYIAAVLFIFAVKQLIYMYHFESQMAAGFNIVLMMGIASLFEPTYIWLSLLFVLGMVIFRVINGRVFFSILLGIATLCIIAGSLFWLFDSLEILTKYIELFVAISPKNAIEITKSDIIIAIFTIGMVAFTFVSYYFRPSNYKLNTLLNFSLINWGFWLSVVWVVIFRAEFTQLIAIPGMFAIMCFSLYFSTNQSKVANVLFVVWFLVFASYRILPF